jgi:hypothetical protein
MAEPRPARARRERSVTESLLSIVLGLEVAVVFFVTLTVYGLNKEIPAGVTFAGGAVLIVLLLLCARMLRYRAGVAAGWALQGVLILTGLLLPAMYLIGAGFAGIWIFCFVKARQIEAAKAAYLATTTETPPEGTHP